MKVLIIVLMALISCSALASQPPQKKSEDKVTEPAPVSNEEPVALQRPNAISLELLGRAFGYSLNYDRSVSKHFGLGAGFEYLSASDGFMNVTIIMVPLYANYYFSPNNSRFFLTSGFDLAFVKASVTLLTDTSVSASTMGIAPFIGGGYEYRADGGFLFRVAPYVFVGKVIRIWLGLSFGVAF